MRNSLLFGILAAATLTATAATPVSFRADSSRVPANTTSSTPFKSLRSARSQAANTLSTRKCAPASPRVAKASLNDQPSTDYVTEFPDGSKPWVMTKDGLGFVSTIFGVLSQETTGCYSDVAVDSDNNVYLSHVWSYAPCDGMLVGKMEGNKVSFQLPQLMMVETYEYADGSVTYYDYALLCEMVEKTDDQGTYKTFEPVENQVLSFTVQPDGSWLNDNPDYMVGQFEYYPDEDSEANDPAYSPWEWYGGGDYVDSLNPFYEVAPEMPAGVEAEDWIKVENDYGYPVEIAFTADKCYMRGAITDGDLADLVMTGNRDGDKLSFPSGQFLGLSSDYGYVVYMEAGRIDQDDDENPWKVLPSLDYIYDAANETITLVNAEDVALCLPTPTYEMTYLSALEPCQFVKVDPNAPIKEISAPYEAGYYEADDYYPVQIYFSYSNLSSDFAFLDLSKLYYQVLIDDDVMEFDPADYNGLDEIISDCPVDASYDYFMYSYSNQVTCPIYVDGYDKIAVRLLYKASDDAEPIYSDQTVVYDTSAVNAIGSDTAVSSSYFDLQGRKMSKPAPGLSIRADKMSDGSVKYVKVMVK